MTTPPNGPDGWYPDPDRPDPGRSNPQGSSRPKKRLQWPWLVLSVVFAVVMVFVVMPQFRQKPDPNAQMISMCQDATVKVSQTPSTVKFVSAHVNKFDGVWWVSGQLDSQNVFGAVIRSTYQCKVTYDLDTRMLTAQYVYQ